MATLIQSKQIQGVVTASVIDGEFVVSGSSLISGSQYILGDITSSGIISASEFVGNGSQLTFGGTGFISGSSQVTLSQVSGYNVFSSSVAASVSGSSTTLPNGVISSSAQITSLGFLSQSTDSQTLTYNQVSKQLTISDGNTVDLSSLGGGGGVGGSSIWSTGSNYYYVNSDLQVTGSLSATSLTGSLDYSNLRNVPGGIISSSEQILGGTGILSGSHTDISSLNDYTSSTDDRISNLELFTSSLDSTYATDNELSSLSSSIATTIDNIQHTQIPSGTISGSSQLTSSFDSRYALSGSVGSGTSDFTQLTNVPSGLVSSSDQVLGGTDILSGSHTDISSLNTFTSSIQSEVDSLTTATSSYLTSIDSGIVSSSAQVTELLPSGVISGSTFDNFSSSVDSRILTEKNRIDAILTASDADKDSFAEIVTLINSVDTTNDNSFAAHYTASNDRLDNLESTTSSLQTQIDSLTSVTSSYVTEIPSGTISGSSQLTASYDSRYALSGSSGVSSWNDLNDVPSGIISSSEQVLGGTNILSGSHTDISSLNTFSSSIQTQVDGLSAQTSSYLTSSGSVDYSDVTNIPSGIISGSSQLTSSFDSRYSLSGSGVTLSGGIISSSQQIADLGYVTSSNEAPFDGNRIVSNTLLGDLYSSSYNAGTSGSLKDFIEEVFFPSSAPTATFTDQTAYWNTNLATGSQNLVSVALTDTVDNSPYSLTLGGTHGNSFVAVPTNSDSSSWEIRVDGSISAGTYTYDVTVGDSTSAERTYSSKTITIAQAGAGTLSTNGTLYIIESATSGVITLSSTGRPGSTGAVSVSYSPNYGSQSATNFSSSNPLISVNSSNGQLSVGNAISGSGNVSGDTITSTISWNDQYGNTDSANISVNVTQNYAPTLSSTLTTNNNTNQATGSAQIIRLTITDTEGDSIPNSGLVWTSYNSTYFNATVSSPYMYLSANNTSIPAGTYSYSATFEDEHGFRTTTYNSSVTINQAGVGTLGGDTTSYIIESALSGSVLRDTTGYNAGNASQLSVSYSPNYGSQVVQSYTSSNSDIVIDNSGNLTLAVTLSGSVTQSGDTLSTDITFADQYGNIGSGSVTVNVFGNSAPSLTFVSSSNYTESSATSGSDAGTLTISDTESDTPFVVSLGGTDGGKFDISGSSSPYKIQPTGSLSQGTYTINISATDTYGESTTLTNKNIIVDSDTSFPPVYVYTSTRTGGGTLSAANYLAIQGGSTVNGDTPPLVTSFTADTTSPFYLLKGGSIGNSSISVGGGTMVLRNTISGSDLQTIVSESFDGSNSTETFMIIFPSGSDMVGTPTSMTDSLGGSTSGEYVLYIKTAGESSFNVGASTIHALELDSAHEGYDKWNIIGRTGTHATTAYEVKLVPSSGSAP